MLEEASARGVEIKFFKTLNDFAKEHASTIGFITEKWIVKNVDFIVLEKLFIEFLGDEADNTIAYDTHLSMNERATGHVNSTCYISSSLKDFFVYEKKDGTILLNLDVQFEVEYEIELERTIEKDNPRYDYVYRTNPISGEQEIDMVYIPDYSIEHEYDSKVESVIFEGKFVIQITGKKADNYEIKEWNWG